MASDWSGRYENIPNICMVHIKLSRLSKPKLINQRPPLFTTYERILNLMQTSQTSAMRKIEDLEWFPDLPDQSDATNR